MLLNEYTEQFLCSEFVQIGDFFLAENFMSILKNKKQSESDMSFFRSAANLFLLILFLISVSGTDLKAQEDNGAGEKTQENSAIETNKGVIINRHGTEIGSIDENGNVLNISGILMGSVDSEGNILNGNGIDVGKVTKEGDVMNQSGTVLGSVNSNGEIFNVSGGKMGEVKGETNLNRIGAAARLIILK
jgi:hypothetical protein